MSGADLVRFILWRLAVAVPLLLLISFGVFALVHLAPGDPVRALLGTRAVRPGDARDDLRERYHLNDPFIVQYGKWLWQVLQGDLGRSINGNRRVSSAISERAGVTIVLEPDQHRRSCSSSASCSASRRRSGAARGSTAPMVMFGVFGISSPAFVTGIFLLYVFGVVLGWFPTFGAGPRLRRPPLAPDAAGGGARAVGDGDRGEDHPRRDDRGAGQGLRHLRAGARHRAPARITFAYVLRNALIPVVTAAGIIVVGLLASAIYVEVTFALPGLGSLIVDAVQKRDIPLIQGTTLVFACFVVLVQSRRSTSSTR